MMRSSRSLAASAAAALRMSVLGALGLLLSAAVGMARDLPEIQADGVLRHLAVPYANFCTGLGDGLDVELIQGFADEIGVDYELVETSWDRVFGDLTGRNARRNGDHAELLDATPIRGDLVANGMTVLDWRREVVDFSLPTFPSAIWLIARADSELQPIEPSGTLLTDITRVKSAMAGHSVLALPNTCLDPDLYGMEDTDAEIRLQPASRQLNEMVPAILKRDAESTLLDVPDALIALERWPGQIKVIGPVSEEQRMAVAFRKSSPKLRAAFNRYLRRIHADGSYARLVEHYYPAVFRHYVDFFREPLP